jgi:hypothetical protein
VETLEVRVLRGLAWLDLRQFDLALQTPRRKMPHRELRPIVGVDCSRRASLGEKSYNKKGYIELSEVPSGCDDKALR